jgi:hypothetical protein
LTKEKITEARNSIHGAVTHPRHSGRDTLERLVAIVGVRSFDSAFWRFVLKLQA